MGKVIGPKHRNYPTSSSLTTIVYLRSEVVLLEHLHLKEGSLDLVGTPTLRTNHWICNLETDLETNLETNLRNAIWGTYR